MPGGECRLLYSQFLWMRRLVPLLTAALACGCASAPPYHELPIQRVDHTGSEPRLLMASIAMSSLYADRHVVSGVVGGSPGDPWRWANDKARLRFQVLPGEGTKFFVDLVIAEITFKETGPVRLKFWVNDKLVGAKRCDNHGPALFETKLAPDVLKPGAVTTVMIETENPWVSTDGTKLGFLLVGAGFKD